jgi:hypothetical protein
MKKKLLVFAALLVLVLVCASVAFAATKEIDEGAYVDWGDEADIAKIGGHAVDQTKLVVDEAPTCTKEGLGHYVCIIRDPGDPVTSHNHYFKYNKLPHTWDSANGGDWGKIVKTATCTEEGKAIDYCTVCLTENPNHYRIIEKLPHRYDNDHYVVVKEKGCGEGEDGLGQHVCIVCGEPKDETEAEMVPLGKLPHNWSDWKVIVEPTCAKYGKASRTCIRCGATQDVYQGRAAWDQGEKITVSMLKETNKLNPNYAVPATLAFTTEEALKAALAGFETVVVSNEWTDCYTRTIKYACPYCKDDANPEHDPFTVTLKVPGVHSHIWKTTPDANLSVAPSCLTDGKNVYLCIYDGVHGHAEPDQVKVEFLSRLGHKWEKEWHVSETYMKDGVSYEVVFQNCERCGAHKQETREVVNPEKQGLIKDEDGVWRLYKDGQVDKTFTDILPFQTGEFWVVKGVVPPEANGLTICPDGKAYFLVSGQIQRVTQWALYNGEWFILKNGELDKVTGLYDYDGQTFAVESGRKLLVNGLWQNPKDGKWVYLAEGRLVKEYTGKVTYDGAIFNVVNGYLVEFE